MDYLTPLVIFGGFAAFFYVAVLRPQQQQQKKIRELHASLAPGDEIVTIGGFRGRIEAVEDDFVKLNIASGVTVALDRSAVGKRVEDDSDAK